MLKASVVLLICSFLVALVQAVPDGRIMNGRSALEGQFPYHILMSRSDGFFCGGSIISTNYVLTAAHCVTQNISGYIHQVPPNNFRIIAGSNNKYRGVWIGVVDIIVHEGFKKAGIHDIALMKLAKPLTFTNYISPISLPRNDPPAGSAVTICGYGNLDNSGLNTQILQWTVVYTIPIETCKLTTNVYVFWDSILCLGHYPNHGSCFGDSGGPAILNNELIGISSFVVRGCGSGVPNGYTRVFPYLNWIEEHSDYREFIGY